jgi:cobalt/nickel transport system permease protein
MHLIDRIAHTNHWSGRHPGDKLLLGGGLLILSLLLPAFPGAPLILLTAIVAAIAGARIPAGEYFRVLLLPASFLISGAAVLAISVRFDGGVPTIAYSPTGMATAMEVSLRALAATASLLLIVLTTPISEFLGLLRRIRVPEAIVDITLLSYRFIVVTIEIADRGRISQTGRLGYVGFRRSLRSAGLLAAALLPRVLDRARRMENGLASRAYQGDLRILPPAVAPSAAFIAISVALLATIGLASMTWGIAVRPIW